MIPQSQIYPEFINHSHGGDNFAEFAESISVQKSINQVIASAQIVLNPVINTKGLKISTPRILMEWKNIFKKNDIISLKKNKLGKKHSFLGFVDHVYESYSASNNNTGRALIINCSLLLPKLLVRDNIINSPELAVLPQLVNNPRLNKRIPFLTWMRGAGNEKPPFANVPEAAVKWILENCIATNTTIGDKNAKTFFRTDIKDVDDNNILDFTWLKNEFLFSPNLSKYSGPIYNYITSCIDKEWYELFFDTTTGTDGLAYNKMIIRPKPFSFKSNKADDNNWLYWEDLKYYEIERDNVLNEQLGTNDFELKNVFQVYYNTSLIGSANAIPGRFGYQFPVVNLESIEKYGLRDLTLASTLMDVDPDRKAYNEAQAEGKGITLSAQAAMKNGLLHNLLMKRRKIVEWYSYPHFESGQLTVTSGEYDLGKKLIYKDKLFTDPETGDVYKGVEYYINSVRDTYRYPEFCETTLGLSKGHPPGLAAKWFKENEHKFISINTLEKEYPEEPAFSLDTQDLRDRRKFNLFDGMEEMR